MHLYRPCGSSNDAEDPTELIRSETETESVGSDETPGLRAQGKNLHMLRKKCVQLPKTWAKSSSASAPCIARAKTVYQSCVLRVNRASEHGKRVAGTDGGANQSVRPSI